MVVNADPAASGRIHWLLGNRFGFLVGTPVDLREDEGTIDSLRAKKTWTCPTPSFISACPSQLPTGSATRTLIDIPMYKCLYAMLSDRMPYVYRHQHTIIMNCYCNSLMTFKRLTLYLIFTRKSAKIAAATF